MSNKMKYPVVNDDPSLDDCIKAMRVSDYLQLFGVTVATWSIGFLRGRPARYGVAGMMGGIGFTFGTIVVVQNTRGRLMGFRENSREMALFAKSRLQE